VEQPDALDLQTTQRTRTRMFDLLICLFAVLIMACFYYGARPLVLCALGAASACVFEWLFSKLIRLPVHLNDLTAVVTGATIALLLPASAPLWMALIGSAFAIVFVKLPFGGNGHAIFNPVAAAAALLSVSWPHWMTKFPEPLTVVPLNGAVQTVSSTGGILRLGGTLTTSPDLLLFGCFPGPMGTTAILVLLACAVYLLVRKAISWQAPAFFLGTCALFALLLPRTSAGRLSSVLFELVSSGLLFGAVFLLTDVFTAPKTAVGRALFGVITGVLTVFFLRFGAFELGLCFALLITNALADWFDRFDPAVREGGRRLWTSIRKQA
jgi:electron transport complex protein RnfD